MKVSNCCRVPPKSNGYCDTEDAELCPRCWEHCTYEDQNPLERIDQLLNKIRDNNNELIALAETLNESNKATYSKKIAAIINETILIMKKTPQANGA